jgi:hypothetical protein
MVEAANWLFRKIVVEGRKKKIFEEERGPVFVVVDSTPRLRGTMSKSNPHEPGFLNLEVNSWNMQVTCFRAAGRAIL